MLCADLVEVHWQDRSGSERRAVANLEDISLSGACLQLEEEVPLQALVRIEHEKARYEGRVRYCIFKDIGYFLGVEFEAGQYWNAREFKPLHLLDPRRLTGLHDGKRNDQERKAAS